MLRFFSIPNGLQVARTLLLLLLLEGASGLSAAGAALDERGPAAIRKAAESVLTQRFPAAAAGLEIRIDRLGGDAGRVSNPRVRFRSLRQLPRGRQQVDVLAHRSGRWHEVGWALLYVAHYDSALVLTHTLRADDPLQPGDVRVTWTETTRVHGTPLTPSTFDTMRAAGSLHARRYLREGQLLREGDVRPPYAARLGQSVLMLFERHGFTLKLRCKARRPGLPGEVIPLYAPDTDTSYRARLTGPGTAVWIETL